MLPLSVSCTTLTLTLTLAGVTLERLLYDLHHALELLHAHDGQARQELELGVALRDAARYHHRLAERLAAADVGLHVLLRQEMVEVVKAVVEVEEVDEVKVEVEVEVKEVVVVVEVEVEVEVAEEMEVTEVEGGGWRVEE